VDKRRDLLTQWFDSCWCSRCTDITDDTRAFRCPVGCGGVTYAMRQTPDICPCQCGETYSNVFPLFKKEDWIIQRWYKVIEDIQLTAALNFISIAQQTLHDDHWIFSSLQKVVCTYLDDCVKCDTQGTMSLLEDADKWFRKYILSLDRVAQSEASLSGLRELHARVLWKMKRYDDAVRTFRYMISEAKSFFADDHPKIANWMKVLKKMLENP